MPRTGGEGPRVFNFTDICYTRVDTKYSEYYFMKLCVSILSSSITGHQHHIHAPCGRSCRTPRRGPCWKKDGGPRSIPFAPPRPRGGCFIRVVGRHRREVGVEVELGVGVGAGMRVGVKSVMLRRCQPLPTRKKKMKVRPAALMKKVHHVGHGCHS